MAVSGVHVLHPPPPASQLGKDWSPLVEYNIMSCHDSNSERYTALTFHILAPGGQRVRAYDTPSVRPMVNDKDSYRSTTIPMIFIFSSFEAKTYQNFSLDVIIVLQRDFVSEWLR